LEGSLAAGIKLDANNLATPKSVEESRLTVDLHPTGSPEPMASSEEKDNITQVPRFLDVEVIARLKCREPVSKPLSNLVAP
jgi:hypothetical protein